MMNPSPKIGFLVVLCLQFFLPHFEGQIILAQSVNKFAIKLYKQLVTANESKLVFSPYSLSMVLSILLVGAGSKTFNELYEVLGYMEVELPIDVVLNWFRFLILTHQLDSKEFKFLVANSMWLQNGLQFKPEFLSLVLNAFFTEGAVVDFEDPSTKSNINNWVKRQTKGKMPKVLDDISKDTVFAVINTVYFTGIWGTSSKFVKNDTINSTFYNVFSNSSQQIAMMTAVTEYRFAIILGLNVDVLEVPYHGYTYNYSMVIILPKNKAGLLDVESKMTYEILNEAIDSFVYKRVNLHLPRLNISSSFKMVPFLKSIGINNAFQKKDANFSAISDSPLFVSELQHNALCEVQEEGIIAATSSASLVEMRADQPRPTIDFIVDHPFLFFIRDVTTGLILFLGRVYEM